MQKKFPVAGEYLTWYEDRIGDQEIIRTAPATIIQKGNKIFGETKYDGEKKWAWTLEGEIDKAGHIYGRYSAIDPLDKGIGNFFLKVESDRRMFGYWSGYDSENNKVLSGKYGFQPKCNDLLIVEMATNHMQHVFNIADCQLGKGYVSADLLGEAIVNNEKYIAKVAIDNENNKVVGFYIVQLVKKQEVNEIILNNPEVASRIARSSELTGLIKTVAVDKNYQGRGVGMNLIKDAISELQNKNIHTIFTIAWKSKYGTNLKGILMRLDFKEIIEIPEYWKESSIKENFECPVCRKPPCSCSAVIYTTGIFW